MRNLILISLVFWNILIANSYALERVVYDNKITEVEGRDFDQIIHNLINDYYDIQDVYSLKNMSLVDKKLKENEFSQRLTQVSQDILSENKLHDYAVLYNSLNDMQRAALKDLTKETIIRFNTKVLYQENSSILKVKNAKQLFPKYTTLASYEYAYGKELAREDLKTYELIRRNTFFENSHHKIDIDIDFLKPIKKIISALKLKSKFSWIWDQKLHFGYHSEFTHYKKIFMREKGYYKKVKVTVELLRRKTSFWGSPGPWKVYGQSVKYFEEPSAIVGFEVKELDS
ncbi:MAG: hypothetical protein COB02_15900 [Candidatus Cloacimonadota bacterium]|nr:MAG: hypothetical protein COB02_15900 [Candidatus Cloacimonadota bacterium]